jgi:HSP20 family molecular chaperone IbpA
VEEDMPGECYEIKLDVQRCNRDEIAVEVTENSLIVQTRKCHPEDNSIVARKFSKRTYPIDLNVYDRNSLHYEFDDHGMLNISIKPKSETSSQQST